MHTAYALSHPPQPIVKNAAKKSASDVNVSPWDVDLTNNLIKIDAAQILDEKMGGKEFNLNYIWCVVCSREQKA